MGYFGIPFRNGVPIGLGSVASFGAQQFDPSSLFIGGTVGTFYDPSDPTTLFTTSTGTTPCAVPGSGSQVLVGLMLDKSQGAPGALGSELIVNGDFSNGTTGWSATNSTLSASNNQLTVTSTANFGIGASTGFTTVIGRTYRATAQLISCSAATARIRKTDSATNFNSSVVHLINGPAIPGQTFTVYFQATATTTYIMAVTDLNPSNITIANISVREIPGNHAIAFNDTTARPELRARVNLLTYSEDFSNAAWTNTAMTVTANATTAPDGSITADTVVPTAVSNLHRLSQNVAVTARTLSVYAKANGYDKIGLKESQTSGEWAAFQLTGSGSVIAAQAGVTASIETLANGWYRCVMTLSAAVSAGLQISALPPSYTGGDVNVSFTGDGTSGYFFWGADLRPANIGSAIPAYQRIADQYTYDSNGFPSYLRFDGVDDSMYTPASINFSGTDKMSVFAGVRKLSDAAQGAVAELSATIASNNGAFLLSAPNSAAANYNFSSKGTTQVDNTVITYAAPNTAVLSGAADITAPSNILRVNAVQAGSVGTSQGTGNFGTYPLYIGSRNNASLRFNGHLYSLVVVGSAVPAGSITATEQYVAGKTGVQI